MVAYINTAEAIIIRCAQELTSSTKKYVAERLEKIIAEEMEGQDAIDEVFN